MDDYLSSLSRAYTADPSNVNAHRLARAFSRVSPRGLLQKVLISPNFGGGWSTSEHSLQARKIMRSHAATITAVEAGETINAQSPCIVAMVEEFRECVGHTPYLGALRGKLKVIEVEGPYYVEEYDGRESIRNLADFD
jgi:hypothetical protein